MSGYAGADDESLHAIILSENGIHAAQQALAGSVNEYCIDCADQIDPKRVQFARQHKMKCVRCVECQQLFDRMPKAKIKMLDWIL